MLPVTLDAAESAVRCTAPLDGRAPLRAKATSATKASPRSPILRRPAGRALVRIRMQNSLLADQTAVMVYSLLVLLFDAHSSVVEPFAVAPPPSRAVPLPRLTM